MSHQPYTYLIKFIPTGQLYYGAKTAKGCHPNELWVKYFTSSKVVKELIIEYGKDLFEIIYIKLHETKEDALKWEELYLSSVDAGYNEEYLNKTNGGKNFTQSGIISHKLGTKSSEETREKQSNAQKGKKYSEEINKKKGSIGKNNGMFGKSKQLAPMFGKTGSKNHGSKKYIITFPDEHEEVIIGLRQFCREYNLHHGHMIYVAKGKQKQHKGFKCRYATEELLTSN